MDLDGSKLNYSKMNSDDKDDLENPNFTEANEMTLYTNEEIAEYRSIKNIFEKRPQFANNKSLDLAAYRNQVKEKSSTKPTKSIFVSHSFVDSSF